jgi:hypothetical protein
LGADPLYRRLLGPDFERLPTILRDFHSGPRQAEGRFSLSLPTGLAKSFARFLFRLPKVEGDRNGTLDVEWTPPGERWTRDIGDWRFITRQWESDGRLYEKHKRLTMVFRIAATPDGLCFRQLRATWWKLPLPTWLAPQISADVTATTSDWTVSVSIRVPFVGEVVRYTGSLRPL